MARNAERPYDVVLFGATGFTGGLTAAYLAEALRPEAAGAASGAGAEAPARPTRWALAGRDPEKLRAVAERIGADVPLLHADVEDPASLRALAESARVVASTVGPFIRHGEPLVAACAAAGTDYVDITGEPEFVDLMYVRHHATAVASGARLVHCCGFDSIPHDLGVQFTVEQLPAGVPLKVEGFVRANAAFSGGTFESALTAFSRMPAMARAARERRALERTPVDDRRVRGVAPRPKHVGGEIGWGLPLPTIDPQIVLRSARALDRYGPEFTYGHYAWVKRLPLAVAGGVGLPALVAAAQVGPLRRAIGRRMVQPGEGPSAEKRARSWFTVRFVGEAVGEPSRAGAAISAGASAPAAPRRVVCEVSGGDPGYTETAKMLAESALCLAHDDLPDVSGQSTTAVAMGGALRARLERAGMRFAVVG